VNITLPSMATVTQTIASLPELARGTVDYWGIAYPVLMARINGGSNPLADFLEDSDEGDHLTPLKPWEAARLGLEFLMLVRSHEQFEEDFHRTIDDAMEGVDNPQHAMDIIIAMANMLAAVASDEDVEKFGQALARAEARAS
jgi:hypothetical protein